MWVTYPTQEARPKLAGATRRRALNMGPPCPRAAAARVDNSCITFDAPKDFGDSPYPQI